MSESVNLTPAQAAERLETSVSTLARWRCNGTGPKFIKKAGRISYRPADLDEYDEDRSRLRTSTREE